MENEFIQFLAYSLLTYIQQATELELVRTGVDLYFN